MLGVRDRKQSEEGSFKEKAAFTKVFVDRDSK